MKENEQTTMQYLLSHKRELFHDIGLWLFIFVCTGISIFQIVLGVLTESLSSYADCVHRMQHVFEYLVVIFGNVLEHRKESNIYSYGYARHEYLLVFTLDLSVIIICCFLLFEMVHGLTDGHHLHVIELSPFMSDVTTYMNYASFIIALITIFGFPWYKRQYKRRYSKDIYQANVTNKSSVDSSDIVHIFIDIFAIVFVVISNYMSFKRGVVIADFIECGVLCVFMIYTTWPEMIICGQILVLGVTEDVSQEIHGLIRRISMVEGVIEIKSSKYWVESPGRLVGMFVIEIHRNANRNQVISTVKTICSSTFQDVVVQIDQDPSLEWMD